MRAMSLKSIVNVVSIALSLAALLPLFLLHTNIFLRDMKEIHFAKNLTSSPAHFSTGALIVSDKSVPAASKIERESSNLSYLWQDGCQRQHSSTIQHSSRNTDPTGLVVVLAVAPDNRYTRHDSFLRICHLVPTQLEYFLNPQKLDLLFIVQEEEHWTLDQFVTCLNLKKALINDANLTSRTWDNIDGTTLTTLEYQHGGSTHENISPTKVYLARTKLQYPGYIQKKPSLLKQPIIPQSCQAPRTYIQATRWYTREFLHLGILKQYDFFIKLDTDVAFLGSIPFHILTDMKNKRALFGHTAEYLPRGSKTCAKGIYDAMVNFTMSKAMRPQTVGLPPWNWTLCSPIPEVQRDTDQYYTNFIVGRVDFWQSPWVLEWANFLSEYPFGFFTYRWTDQIFWHYAMGLFLHNFKDFVVDYTNLRCMPHPNCWRSSYNFQRFGPDAWHNCDNGGYFLHTKDYRIAKSKNSSPAYPDRSNSSRPIFQSTYEEDCSKK